MIVKVACEGERLRRAARLLYPILFAIALVLGTAAQGAGQYRAVGLAQIATAAALLTALALLLVLAMVRVMDRTDRAEPLGSVLTMVLVAWFFYYVPAQRAAQAITWRFSRDAVLVPLGLIATAALLVWLLRQSRDRLVVVNGFMARFGALLLIVVASRLAFSQHDTPAAASRSALVRELAVPIRVSEAQPPGRNRPRRDIYLIVLDGHPNARSSGEVLQFGDSTFTDSLRALGFVIPREMHSNYAQTILSMSSLLNGSLLTQLAQDAGEKNPSFALPAYLVENNRTARFLRRQGYKYVLFPSAWWTQSQHSPLADSVFDARPEFTLSNELRRTLLRQAVLNSTLLRYGPAAQLDTSHERRTMAGLRRLPADSTPTFAFAHILLPHLPYYLDASCHVLARPIMPPEEDSSAAQRAAHLAQMQCVDRMVLDVVTTLLRDSPIPPVILVVGDHGTRFSSPHFVDRPERQSTAFIRERFAAFGAFYLPAGGDSAFTGRVSLVNVMGKVLRYYFGADVPTNPDEMYVSGTLPYRFYRVDSTGYLAR